MAIFVRPGRETRPERDWESWLARSDRGPIPGLLDRQLVIFLRFVIYRDVPSIPTNEWERNESWAGPQMDMDASEKTGWK
jgi:hypothetical protein